MKQLLTLALAAAFILSSCGGAKPADTAATSVTTPSTTTTPAAPAAAASLPEQAADCMCPQITEMASLKKEIDAAPDAKKAEIAAKMEAIKEPACMVDLEAKIKALPQADQDKMEGEFKAFVEKKCGAAMKELGGL